MNSVRRAVAYLWATYWTAARVTAAKEACAALAIVAPIVAYLLALDYLPAWRLPEISNVILVPLAMPAIWLLGSSVLRLLTGRGASNGRRPARGQL